MASNTDRADFLAAISRAKEELDALDVPFSRFALLSHQVESGEAYCRLMERVSHIAADLLVETMGITAEVCDGTLSHDDKECIREGVKTEIKSLVSDARTRLERLKEEELA